MHDSWYNTDWHRATKLTLQQQLKALQDSGILRGALLDAGVASERRQRGGLHHGAAAVKAMLALIREA